MKVAIIGSSSKTAYALYPKIEEQAKNIESFWFSSSDKPHWFLGENWIQIDYKNLDDIVNKINEIKPDKVVNLAAYTDVDGCEDNKFESHFINYELPKILAEHSKDSFHFIHISTDYVFDGLKGLYEITDERAENSIGWYALSKKDSENIVLDCGGTIIRTNVLYDNGEYKANFLTWIKDNFHSKSEISIVHDQFNNPTLTSDLAESIMQVIQKSIKGIIHTGGVDWISRWELAQTYALSLDTQNTEHNFKPIISSSLQQKSPRPSFGGLSIKESEKILGMKFSGIYDFILEHTQIPKDSTHYEILQRLIFILRLIDDDLRKRVLIDIVRNEHKTISINISNEKILAEIEIGKSSYSGMLYIYNNQNLNLITGEVFDNNSIQKFMKSLSAFA